MAVRATSNCAVIIVVLSFIFMAAAFPQHASAAPEIRSGQDQSSPYSIRLFNPGVHSIHSNEIHDLINGLQGDVIIATSFGLSTYNGTWDTRHTNLNNISQGLFDEFVTAIEYDNLGNLWIGYSGGIQIYNGIDYQSIRDQQLLKDTRILDLQRWNDDMWIATGNAGIHRYRDGDWTWFQPWVGNGPAFYEINSMKLDSASNSLVIATEDEGLWIVRSPDDPVHFELIADKNSAYGKLGHVRRDPEGGVYFFDSSTVVHYSPYSGFKPVLTVRDLTEAPNTINDIAAASDGRLILATDDGIYIWQDGAVYRHISRFEGIGTSAVVRTVNVDASNRVWFTTQETVGYYIDNSGTNSLITIAKVAPTAGQTPASVNTVTLTITPSPVQQPDANKLSQPSAIDTILGLFRPVTDPITNAINAVTSTFGLKIF